METRAPTVFVLLVAMAVSVDVSSIRIPSSADSFPLPQLRLAPNATVSGISSGAAFANQVRAAVICCPVLPRGHCFDCRFERSLAEPVNDVE